MEIPLVNDNEDQNDANKRENIPANNKEVYYAVCLPLCFITSNTTERLWRLTLKIRDIFQNDMTKTPRKWTMN